MIDVLIKLPPGALDANGDLRGQLTAWLGAQDLGRHVLRESTLVRASHDVAIRVIDNLLVKPGVYDGETEITPPEFDGPHLMVRFPDRSQAKQAWEAVKDRLPGGVSVRANPGTVGWF